MNITAQSYCVYDCITKSVLKSRKHNLRREVASLTKMMTFITVIKLVSRFNLNPNKTFITVSKAGSHVIGTTANLKEGDILSVDQLYYGMMLPSGNDAAYTLAEYFGQLIIDKSKT